MYSTHIEICTCRWRGLARLSSSPSDRQESNLRPPAPKAGGVPLPNDPYVAPAHLTTKAVSAYRASRYRARAAYCRRQGRLGVALLWLATSDLDLMVINPRVALCR